MQYSFNKQIVKRFNDTIKNLNYNEHLLASKIYQLNNFINNQTYNNGILVAKDFLNQLIILYNTLSDILQDIQNSLTFCKLRALHPSIIKPADLLFQLKEITSHYHVLLPFDTKYENLLDYESVIKINCKILPYKIVYFLSIPINAEKDFELYKLLSVPTKQDNEYVTIIPKNKYFLKSKFNEIIALNDICPKSNNYQCPSHNQLNGRSKCEENILLEGNSKFCNYTKLNLEEGHLEILKEINQYLAVFPQQEKVTIRCHQGSETKVLHGIYLIKQDTCRIFYKNKELTFQQESFGKPNLINNINLKIKENQVSKLKLNLKNFQSLKLYPNYHYVEPEEATFQNYYHFNIWTMAIYVGIVIAAVYFLVRFLKKRFTTLPPTSTEGPSSPSVPKRVNLPGEASF